MKSPVPTPAGHVEAPRAENGVRILAIFGARVIFGQERANIETLAQLRAAGFEVLCVVREEDWPELLAIRAALEARELNWVKCPYVDYPIKGWLFHALRRNPGAYLRANRTVAKIAAKFQPTHVHAFNPFYVANFWRYLNQVETPLIYRAGDRPILHNFFYRAVWRFITKRADHFVADSLFIAERLVESGVDVSKISVIYAPPPRRTSVCSFVSPVVPCGRNEFRFVYVGQIVEHKGIGVLVDAFAQIADICPHAKLLIAGPISDWAGDRWARDLRAKVFADPRLADRAHFLGMVEDVNGLLRHCHAHVAPTIAEEPYGLVVVEAKQAARPSIIFESGGMAELVTDGVDGSVLSQKNAESLARALEMYATNPELAVEHGKAAAASLERLQTTAFGSRWRDIYTKVRT